MAEPEKGLAELLKESKKPDKFIEAIGGAATPPDDEAIAPGVLKEGNLARPSNKPLPRLHVVTKDGTTHTFMFHQLDSNAKCKGDEFEFVFAGAKHWALRFRCAGTKRWEIYDYITLARWPFIVEATRDFGGDTEAVFTDVQIVDVTPKMG